MKFDDFDDPVFDEYDDDYEFNVKYCPTCNRCWEQYRERGDRVHTEYYIDFPTIGVPREECPKHD